MRRTARSIAATLGLVVVGLGAATGTAGAEQVFDLVAGGGSGGDGGPALGASLDQARGVSATPDGGFLIGEHTRVRRVSPDGTISTLASGLFDVRAVAASDGGAIVAEETPNDVKRISPAGLVTATIPAQVPTDVASLGGGAFLLAEYGSCGAGGSGQVRRIDDSGATVGTYTGIGCPSAVAPTVDGGFLSASSFPDCRIYKVSADGMTTTSVAGTGSCDLTGDGGPATDAAVAYATGLAALPDGSYFIGAIANSGDNRIRQVTADGKIHPFAGGESDPIGFGLGEGCPAARGWLSSSGQLSVTAAGSLLVANFGTSIPSRIDEIKDGAVTALPRAGLSVSPNPVLTGDAVSFDASASADSCGSPLEFAFDVDGNGTFERDTGAVDHTTASYAERGPRQVGVRVTGTAGRTRTAFVTLGVRPAPPPGFTGVSINGGDRFTNDPHVELHVVWPAFTRTLVVSNDGGFADASVTAVEPRVPWTLDSSGSERLPKTIYARFDDSTQTFQDDIILDQTDPTITQAGIEEAGSGRALAKASDKPRFRLRVRARDNVSGVARIQFTRDRTHPGRWRKFRTSIPLSSSKTRWVRIRDTAHNASRWRKARLSDSARG